jgi:glycosyltransferase involved in cell wall biosynthesis
MDDTLINRARCSVKLLELMAAGLPVIAGQVGQVMEYITHGESGILVAPSNPAALAQATLRLLDDTPLRLRLGKAAQARVVQHFNWDTLASTVEHAYGLALNG